MNVTIFSISIFTVLYCGPIAADAYLLSSEGLVRENQASLTGFKSFIFVPLFKPAKKETNTITFIHKELQRVGTVERKRVFTEQGADLTSFSNPSLMFALEQLVDKKGKPLPVIKATLAIHTSVEVLRNNEIDSLSTNCWSIYVKQDENVEKVIRATLPDLLNKFLVEYQSSNGKDENPLFYIVDTSESVNTL